MSTITNHVKGKRAEYAALLYFMGKGYRPVKLRYKTKVGEIDLIVRRGTELVFVEVKARADRTDAAYAIHTKNQSRVMQAAQQFLQQYPSYSGCQVRFDAMLIAWYKWPRHLVNAFGLPI